MNAAELLEQTCSDAWPPLRQDRLGEWRLRWAAGFTGRANSALAVGDAGVPTADALRIVCEFAHSREITPVVQAVHGSRIEAEITATGWLLNTAHLGGHHVSVLVGHLHDRAASGPFIARHARKAVLTASAGVRMLAGPTRTWWELTAGTAEPSEAQRHVLTGGTVGFGVVDIEGATAGAVRAAVVGDLLHISRLAVRPEYRRRGLAADLLDAAGAWGRERGATRAVLQVSVTNAPALALYRALGFTEHHRYRYWVPPR